MKKRILIVFFGFTCAANAGELRNKSLFIGTSDSPGKFATCVAKAAVDQVLSNSHSFLRLVMSTKNAEHESEARIIFMGKRNGSNGRDSFQVTLTALDLEKNWQLIQHQSGEIAPFCTKISDHGNVFDIRGNLQGAVDLSNCAEQ